MPIPRGLINRMRLVGSGAGYTPANLPSLVAWWRSDQGVSLDGSNLVQSWTDLSPSAWVASQATAGTRPAVNATGINGKRSVVFTGSKVLTNALNNIVTAGSSYSVFIVGKTGNGAPISFRTSTVYETMLLFQPGGIYFVYGDGVNSSANITIATAVTETNGVNPFKSCHRFTGIADNPGVWINTTQRAITSGGTTHQSTPTGATGFMIGSSPAPGNQFWNGHIGEIIITSSAVSPADRQAIEAYQASYWGF